MHTAAAIETRRPIRETALQRLAREIANFFDSLFRIAALSGLLIPVLLLSFLTVDMPLCAFDHAFAAPSAKPGNWLSAGLLIMAAAPLLVILIARRHGGEEASRVVTASWTLAALAAFAGVSYLSPALVTGDMPGIAFIIAFVGSAIISQYVAAAVYDVVRGGEKWWRAPLYAALSAYAAQSLLYFPIAYSTSGAPWLNWIVQDLALKSVIALAFLGAYRLLRKKLRPRRGLGG